MVVGAGPTGPALAAARAAAGAGFLPPAARTPEALGPWAPPVR
ncbi:MAG TPA: hypothetical protein VE546_20220 [Streptomyces sp.]|nr:hypothetical protein [Streptomyces sp.]HZG05870.1 hypothetical protein [Streptomyces sp.]